MPDSLANSSTATLIGVVVTALLSAIGGVFVARRKGNSDDVKSLVEMRIAGLDHHDKIIERQQKEIDRQEQVIQRLSKHIKMIESELRALQQEIIDLRNT